MWCSHQTRQELAGVGLQQDSPHRMMAPWSGGELCSLLCELNAALSNVVHRTIDTRNTWRHEKPPSQEQNITLASQALYFAQHFALLHRPWLRKTPGGTMSRDLSWFGKVLLASKQMVAVALEATAESATWSYIEPFATTTSKVS